MDGFDRSGHPGGVGPTAVAAAERHRHCARNARIGRTGIAREIRATFGIGRDAILSPPDSGAHSPPHARPVATRNRADFVRDVHAVSVPMAASWARHAIARRGWTVPDFASASGL